jgi:DNA-binding transcriptional ArsR family regulator
MTGDDALALIDSAIAALRRLRERVAEAAEPAPAPASDLDDIRQAAADMGISVFSGTVSEPDAARLLGRSYLTLRNRRLTDQPIPFERVGRSVRYRLEVLAKHRGTGA